MCLPTTMGATSPTRRSSSSCGSATRSSASVGPPPETDHVIERADPLAVSAGERSGASTLTPARDAGRPPATVTWTLFTPSRPRDAGRPVASRLPSLRRRSVADRPHADPGREEGLAVGAGDDPVRAQTAGDRRGREEVEGHRVPEL